MKMINTVAVQFKGYRSSRGQGIEYHYLSDLDLKVGDNVIVESPSEGYVVVIVTKLCGPLESSKATKWIVQKVLDEEYKKREEVRRQKAVIEAKLKAIEKQYESSQKYAYLASFSPEAADLLKQLENIR